MKLPKPARKGGGEIDKERKGGGGEGANLQETLTWERMKFNARKKNVSLLMALQGSTGQDHKTISISSNAAPERGKKRGGTAAEISNGLGGGGFLCSYSPITGGLLDDQVLGMRYRTPPLSRRAGALLEKREGKVKDDLNSFPY